MIAKVSLVCSWMDYCNWHPIREFKEVIRASDAGGVAARIKGSEIVQLFYDPVLVKEPHIEPAADLSEITNQLITCSSGKTFTIAKVIEETQRPAIILAPNKTLAAQLYGEFKGFFPDNAVEYFVSYYDYYQPEAYVARSDTYIEKESQINEQIDRMRHSATRALLERDDVIIVASVSCIYGIGSVETYGAMTQDIHVGKTYDQRKIIADLIAQQYRRNDQAFQRGTFRVRGDSLEIWPAHLDDRAWKLSFFGEELENITEFDPLTGTKTDTFDKVLVAVGRTPNGKKIDADKAGVAVDERGFIAVDSQQRTGVNHIFAIGDLVGQPMLAHKAVHEGKVAAEVCAGHKRHFDAKLIPSVAYTDPEVAWCGVTETEAKAKGIKYEKGVFPWAASGKALAGARSEGMTKLLFDPEDQRVIGGCIVGVNAGDLIAEVGLAIEMGADAVDLGHTIHAHPTLSETVNFAAEMFEGTITDLIPPKKKKR